MDDLGVVMVMLLLRWFKKPLFSATKGDFDHLSVSELYDDVLLNPRRPSLDCINNSVLVHQWWLVKAIIEVGKFQIPKHDAACSSTTN